jgi:hypothetical protein
MAASSGGPGARRAPASPHLTWSTGKDGPHADIRSRQVRTLLDRALSEETEERLPHVIGGLSLALARVLAIIDPEVRNPQTAHCERAFKTIDELI